MLGVLSIMHGHDCLFVVVNKISKMEVLKPCKKSVITEVVSKFFFKHVWIHFGFPKTIVYDRDNKFLTIFWSIIDTKFIKMTTFHH
jgi:hypothetical protein